MNIPEIISSAAKIKYYADKISTEIQKETPDLDVVRADNQSIETENRKIRDELPVIPPMP